MKALPVVDLEAAEQVRRQAQPKAASMQKGPLENVKFKLYGEEVVNKIVSASGKCGRIYLPLGWVGKRVKIIRVD